MAQNGKDVIDYVRTVFGIANHISATLYVAVLFALQTSKDKSHHTAFFTIYKVTALYGIANLLTSYNFDICNHTPWLYKFIEFINTMGSLSFVTGCLFIEIQRYLVLRSPKFGENTSSLRLFLIFAGQFLFFFLIQVRIIPAGIELDKYGCVDDMDWHYQRVLRSFVAFFYLFYVVSSLTLTTVTIRRMKATEKAKKRGLHLSLVRYSIYCSFAQMSKGVVQLISSIALFTQYDAAKDLHLMLYYPVNFIAINSTLFLLLYFSRSVRRRVLKIYCCKSPSSVKVVTPNTSKNEEQHAKPVIEMTPIQ